MFNKESLFSDDKLRELVTLGFESEELDYKLYVDLDSKKCSLEICSDVMAMANTRGGYIIIGVANDFSPVGLPPEFHIDQARIQQIVGTYLKPVPESKYLEKTLEINETRKKFAFIYVKPSDEPIVACKEGNYTEHPTNKTISCFRSADIFVRKGSSSQRADSDDLRRLIQKLAKKKHRPNEKSPAN